MDTLIKSNACAAGQCPLCDEEAMRGCQCECHDDDPVCEEKGDG